ncbi:MAG: hypothetical protein AAEJ52_09380 [Myxococcota bacterium]
MPHERFQRRIDPIVTGVSVVLLVSVVAVYGYVSFVLPGDVDVTDHGSSIYDMDIQRVVVDLTSELEGYRTSVHPLQKLFVAPLGIELNSIVFGGANRLWTAKLLVGAFMLLQALLVCVLAYQLTGGALPAGLAAGVISSFSFSSLLAASLPESAALASVGATIPLIWLGARTGRPFSGWEVVGWALIGVVCIGLTITQIVCWMIALMVRIGYEGRGGKGAGLRISPRAVRGAALSVALFLVVTWSAVQLQSELFSGTPEFYTSNPIAGEQPFFRLGSIGLQPIHHTLRLVAHFAVFDFAAPFPGFSDFLIRDYGFDYWSLSIEEARIDQVTPLQWGLAAFVLLGVGVGCLALRRADARFVAPGLWVASQFGLHFFYGREYILYAPHWHGVWVAMLVAACWNAWPKRRTALLVASGVLGIAMLANNLAVLSEAYRQVEAGLGTSVRDSHGTLR